MISLLLGAAMISFAAVFVRLAQVSPDVSAFYRMFFGGLALAVFLWREGHLRCISVRVVKYAVFAGVLFALDIMCWHRSILAIGPGMATLLGNFQVFVLTAASVLVLGERPGKLFYLALPPAFVGLYLVVGVGWGEEASADYRTGVFWGLLTALFYGSYLLCLKLCIPRLGEDRRQALMGVIPWTTCLCIGGYLLLDGQALAVPMGMDLLWLVLLGVICQAAGWLFITRGMQAVSAALVGLGLLLQPVLSYVWDVLIFAKPLTVAELAGAGLALAAIYLGTVGGRK
ncbi:DMT family transporter [Salidesulfovibrio onnuriiensis]|uniref:DMT family transporter n=1 Tax=Salidesulfovibrio onnuriiensis TaxID=2583823 RepID=UPI0011CAC7CA|nr:DMT family transporter [Salidesulfovibrio onnuriiensis]